jgi:phosphatidylserine/phosphatidylglycerophosphate/cardiolipin synthase-like enzyme
MAPGNRVDYYIDGWATFAAFDAAIRTTFSVDCKGVGYIYLLGWRFDGSIQLVPKKETALALLKRASDEFDVQVRVMLWDQLGVHNDSEVDSVNSLNNGLAILDNNTLQPNVGSQHQKVLIVKGTQGLIGFCGGVDINRDRVEEGKNGTPQHDVHCRIAGPGANALVDVFAQRWLNHPDSQDLEIKRMVQSGKSSALWGLVDRQPARPSNRGEQVVGIARTFNIVTPKFKCARDRTAKQTILAAIATAQTMIYVEDQYLWKLDAAAAIGQALLSKPNLRFVAMVCASSEAGVGASLHRRFMRKILETAGKAAVSQRVRTALRLGRTPERRPMQTLGPGSYVHAKCWMFDDELAIIGSANCNRRGYESDGEVIAAIIDKPCSVKDPSFAQTLRRKLWAYHLDVPEGSLHDATVAFNYWPTTDIPVRGYACWYDLVNDYSISDVIPDDIADPGDGNLEACPANFALRDR